MYPDYCIGWLYVTTPRVGLALVEVSVLRKDQLVVTNDDNFITGILRELLPWVSINQLGDYSGLIYIIDFLPISFLLHYKMNPKFANML